MYAVSLKDQHKAKIASIYRSKKALPLQVMPQGLKGRQQAKQKQKPT
jgi:hypothetical protein